MRRNSITHGHNFKLFLSHNRVDVRKYFFVSVSRNGMNLIMIFAVLQRVSNFIYCWFEQFVTTLL